jgi:cyclic lactone autoinducer peptide
VSDDTSPILPAHIEDTVGAIARLQTQHELEATTLERLTEQVTATLGTPGALLAILLLTVAWTSANQFCTWLGYEPPDPAPFNGLEVVLSLAALCVTVIILTTQRRADKLSGLREQLTLELAILGEQKTAKVIALLEETRRDNPQLRNREDAEAADMGRPADPEAVLKAIVKAPTGEPNTGDLEATRKA